MQSTTSAMDVAAYLLHLASEQVEDGERAYLTPMQLQKLLYYVQGWSLAEWGRPMFADTIEAWDFGPVVEPVYQRFRAWGGRPIVEDAAGTPGAPNVLSEAERALVREVWERYNGFSGLALSRMTHAEAPWIEARRGLSPDDRSRRPLDTNAMRAEFDAKVARLEDRLAARADRLRDAARDSTTRLTGKPTL